MPTRSSAFFDGFLLFRGYERESMNLPSRAAHGVLKKDVELGVKLSNFGKLFLCALC
jgi:hypothetical protein